MMLRYFFGCLISLLVCLQVVPAWADVAFISNTPFTAGAAVTTRTVSVTVNASTNTIYVCAQARGNNASFATGVQFNGSENFTALRQVVNGSNVKAEIWRLNNPTVTTANVVITWPNTTATSFTANGDVMQFSGADGTEDSGTTNSGTSTTPSGTFTTSVNGSMGVSCVVGQHASGLTLGANGTQAQNNTANSIGHATSYIAKPTAGSTTLDWTQTSAGWAIALSGIKASVGGSTCRGALMLMGVGGC